MDSIIEKLTEIESVAGNIVTHAEQQKSVLEKEIQEERNQFDADLKQDTEQELAAIRADLQAKMDQLLNDQKKGNDSTINAIQKDYETNHEKYADTILKHIIEV